MQTIIKVLDSEKMSNPDLDIRYLLPDRIEEYTEGLVKDNYNKDLQKLLISPFDINLGYSV